MTTKADLTDESVSDLRLACMADMPQTITDEELLSIIRELQRLRAPGEERALPREAPLPTRRDALALKEATEVMLEMEGANIKGVAHPYPQRIWRICAALLRAHQGPFDARGEANPLTPSK